jgi:hypothetical protein
MAEEVDSTPYCETQAGDLSGYIQQILSRLLRPNIHGKRLFFKGIDLQLMSALCFTCRIKAQPYA